MELTWKPASLTLRLARQVQALECAALPLVETPCFTAWAMDMSRQTKGQSLGSLHSSEVHCAEQLVVAILGTACPQPSLAREEWIPSPLWQLCPEGTGKCG